jgi:hypothetical protein
MILLVIDDLKELIPSHAMRQVVAPAKDLCNMTIHFMPEGVRDIMRYDLAAVQKSSVGANIVLKMIYELALMGLASGIQYGDAQTTARATHRVHTKVSSYFVRLYLRFYFRLVRKTFSTFHTKKCWTTESEFTRRFLWQTVLRR